MPSWNDATINEFHAKAGKGVGPFGDRLILLTTVGARSGKERTSPVVYHRDGERYVIIASTERNGTACTPNELLSRPGLGNTSG